MNSSQRFYPFFIATIVALGGFLLGFDGTVNSGAVPFYRQSLAIYDNSFLLGLSSGAIILGSIFGNFFAGVLGDILGRKRALFITGALFAVAALGTALATHIAFFIAAKIIGGLGVGIAILIAPVYISEVAPAAMRGRLVSINQLNIVLGIFAAYFSNYFILQWVPDPELNWRWMLGAGAIPAALYILLLLVIPESPRWLLQRNRDHEALTVLQKIGGQSYAEQEFAGIVQSLGKVAAKASLTSELQQLFSKSMSRILFIAIALAVFQQLSGINSVLYYAPMVFETSGVGRDNAFLQTIILGAVFVVMTLVAMAFIDKLGRKMLLLMGCGIMAVSLLSVSFAFYSARYNLPGTAPAQIAAQLLKQKVVEQATRNNPDNYRYDQFNILDNRAELKRSGELIATVDLGQPAMQVAQAEAKLIERVLTGISGQQLDSDRAFFAALKQQLQQQGTKEVEKLLNDLKQPALNAAIQIKSMLVLIGLLGFIAGFSISLGPVTWTMLAEIFPNHLRGIGISCAGVVNACTSFVVATIFPLELEVIGSAASYLIYGVAMLLCILVVWWLVPETKGKSLEELETTLRAH